MSKYFIFSFLRNSSHYLVLLVFSFFLLTSCKQNVSHQQNKICIRQSSLALKYSNSFSVDYYNGFKVVKVFGRKDTLTYVLFPKGKEVPNGFEFAIKIPTPINRVTCLSTTHIAALSLLHLTDKIVSVANTHLIFDSAVNDMVRNHTVQDIGKDFQPDYEMMVASQPDLVMSDGEYSEQFAKMKSLKLNVLGCKDYFEQAPLARAEWLKFVAVFFDKEIIADSIFALVENNYNTHKSSVESAKNKPTVFCNMPYKELWYMPCGANYTAHLIADAGGDFLWKESNPTNGFNLTLNFEQVYSKAANASVWLNVNNEKSAMDLLKIDKKFALFSAFKKRNLYSVYGRESKGGGTDLWESGVYRPDLIIKDLIQIFHPEISKNYKLYYYKKIG
jgi:iron complex transport system substrate-binding protein